MTNQRNTKKKIIHINNNQQKNVEIRYRQERPFRKKTCIYYIEKKKGEITMIINKFYEKLYKEFINKLESDYILIPNTPENRKAINNALTAVPYTVKSLEKDSKIFKALSNKSAKSKQFSILPKISKTLSLILIATLICMPFNTINTFPTPTYYSTVQVSTLDISDGSSHQKGKNKLSEIQEQYTTKNQAQRNLKNSKKKIVTNTYNHNKQNKSLLALSAKKATQLLSTFKEFFLKIKNTYDNLSDAYDVITALFVLISTVKESIRSKKSK